MTGQSEQPLDDPTASILARLREAMQGHAHCPAPILEPLFPEIRACDRVGLVVELSRGWGSPTGFIASMMPILPAWSDMGYDDWRNVLLRAHPFGLVWAVVPFMYQQLEVDSVRMVIELRPGDPDVAQSLRWPCVNHSFRRFDVPASHFGLPDEVVNEVRQMLYSQGAPQARETPVRFDPIPGYDFQMATSLPPEGEEETIPAYRRSAGIRE